MANSAMAALEWFLWSFCNVTAVPHILVLSGHLQLNMARLCSRNTKIINECNEKMIVEVTQNPGGFVDKSLSIPPGGHQYICYSDFHIGSNPDRVIDVRFYVGSATKTVSPSEIRDHGKLVLNYQDDTGTGTVTVTFIKGKLIPRIGLFIKLNRAAKKMKSLVKHIIGGIINETS